MNHKVTSIPPDRIAELAKRDDVTVMTHAHDVVFEPWSAERVMRSVDALISITRKCNGNKSAISEEIKADPELNEFSQKYLIFCKKLSDMQFVNDERHVQTLKRIILLRLLSERGELTEKQAQAQASDIALTSLASRMKEDKK